jgi:ribulose kinase
MNRRKIVFGIYNADGTFFGELGYLIAKLSGKRSCSLCDVTHGWNPFGKREWKGLCKSSLINIQLIHQNEATESQLKAAGDLPSFISETEEGWTQIMTSAQITRLKREPDRIVAILEEATNTE